MGSSKMQDFLQEQFWAWTTLGLVVVTLALVAILHSVQALFTKHFWKLQRLQHIMEHQGWKGAPFRLFVGNVHEVKKFRDEQVSKPLAIRDFATTPRVHPQLALYSRKYGDKCFYYQGPELKILVTDPNLVKEIFLKTFAFYKMEVQTTIVCGQFGLPTINGEEWVLHRRLVDHAFHHESIKGMVNTMVKCTTSLLQTWEQKLQVGKGSIELEITNEMSIITADIIAHTAFNIDYEKGKQVFAQIDALLITLSKALNNPFSWIPGYRFLPTLTNRKIAELIFKINEALKELIHSRQDAIKKGKLPNGEDLLGLMISTTDENWGKERDKSKDGLSLQSLVDQCKTFFLAGSKTSALVLAWTLLLLAEYPEWQNSARAEIFEVCGHNVNDLDASTLTKMKIVGMIFNEVLRLFPITPIVPRTAMKDMQIGDIFVPKGLVLETSVNAIHRDPKLWGADALEFNPNRFVDGVSKACQHPQGYLPFSLGPRFCIGQSFANMELKVMLAMMLSQFQFSVSPNYRHCPIYAIVQKPLYGVKLIVQSLKPTTS